MRQESTLIVKSTDCKLLERSFLRCGRITITCRLIESEECYLVCLVLSLHGYIYGRYVTLTMLCIIKMRKNIAKIFTLSRGNVNVMN